jgi:hypothetical protein
MSVLVATFHEKIEFVEIATIIESSQLNAALTILNFIPVGDLIRKLVLLSHGFAAVVHNRTHFSLYDHDINRSGVRREKQTYSGASSWPSIRMNFLRLIEKTARSLGSAEIARNSPPGLNAIAYALRRAGIGTATTSSHWGKLKTRTPPSCRAAATNLPSGET